MVLFVSFPRLNLSERVIVWIVVSVFLNNPSHGYEQDRASLYNDKTWLHFLKTGLNFV